MSAVSNIVFDDLFTIIDIDREGKKFDRVSRLNARSANFDMHLSLDFNVEIYPLRAEEKFTMALATSLSRSGAAGDKDEGDQAVWRPDGKGRRGLEEDYEYVMHGKIYKFDEGTGETV